MAFVPWIIFPTRLPLLPGREKWPWGPLGLTHDHHEAEWVAEKDWTEERTVASLASVMIPYLSFMSASFATFSRSCELDRPRTYEQNKPIGANAKQRQAPYPRFRQAAQADNI